MLAPVPERKAVRPTLDVAFRRATPVVASDPKVPTKAGIPVRKKHTRFCRRKHGVLPARCRWSASTGSAGDWPATRRSSGTGRAAFAVVLRIRSDGTNPPHRPEVTDSVRRSFGCARIGQPLAIDQKQIFAPAGPERNRPTPEPQLRLGELQERSHHRGFPRFASAPKQPWNPFPGSRPVAEKDREAHRAGTAGGQRKRGADPGPHRPLDRISHWVRRHGPQWSGTWHSHSDHAADRDSASAPRRRRG